MDFEETLDRLLSDFIVKLGVTSKTEPTSSLLEDLKWKIIGIYSASAVNLGDLSQWLPSVALSTDLKKES